MHQQHESAIMLRNRKSSDCIQTQDETCELLLKDSKSEFVKDEDDDITSNGSISLSRPELEAGQKDRLLNFKKEKVLQIGRHEGSVDDINLDNTDCIEENISNCVEPITNHILQPNDIKIRLEDEKLISNDGVKFTVPDGGWGWVVVFSSFVISVIADGISFSFGLLYIEFLDEFKASKAATAWIGSLFIAVPLLSGPLMSVFVDRYGCRNMTILGGIISTLGFVLASISTSLEMIMITFGVIAGLGLGLVYVTAVVSTAFWFDKKMNLAAGLGACGTGLGTFVYAPVTQYLIEEFGWRGTVLILSGSLLNICVCGCVMRDPEWWILEQKKHKLQKEKNKSNKTDSISKQSSSVSFATSFVNDNDIITRGMSMKKLISGGLSPEKVIRDEFASIQRREHLLSLNKLLSEQRSKSLTNIPTYLTYNDKALKIIFNSLIEEAIKNNGEHIKYPPFQYNSLSDNEDNGNSLVKFTEGGLPRNRSEKFDNRRHKMLEHYQLNDVIDQVEDAKLDELQKSLPIAKEKEPLIKQNIKDIKQDYLTRRLSVNYYYFKDLKMPLNYLTHRNAMLNIQRCTLKASSCPDICKGCTVTVKDQEKKWHYNCISLLVDTFHISLFENMNFIFLCLGTSIIYVWYIVPYFYLTEHMIRKGYSEDDGAFMLSLIGITNTIGMISLGLIGDFANVAIDNVYVSCLILCGTSVAAIPPAVSNYWILAFLSLVFGLLFAATLTFTPSILVRLVPLDDFTSAYGLVLLAQGIGHLIGPPLSGLLYDITLSWELAFFLSGGFIIMAGFLLSSIHPMRVYQPKRDAAEKFKWCMA